MILDIIKLPTPSLRNRSTEIDRDYLSRTETQEFIDNMIPTMYDDDGIGLAAPQVAQNIRICVIGKAALPKKLKLQEGEVKHNHDLVLVNPEWERLSKKTETELEGCLSVPNTFGKVKRFKSIGVKAWDRHGHPLTFEADNFFARVIQHEVDHLDGVLFIDKATGIYEVDENHSRL